MASLQEMREAQNDVTLLLPDDSSIPCHKLVLMASCPFFKTMFNAGLKETTEKEVRVEFADADTIKTVIDFIYSGKVNVSDENVKALAAAAEFLCCEGLKAFCSAFLIKSLASSNACELLKFAKMYRLDDLVSESQSFIVRHFDEVRSKPEFLELTEDDMVEIVSNSELQTSSEDRVYESVVQWAKLDGRDR
jgi:hypothetical protein